MHRNDLRRLSRLRISEARLLLRAGAVQGAYYLAGYAVECALKACIARQFQQHDLPDRALVNDVYTHDLDRLLGLAGLRPALKQEAAAYPLLQTNWDVVKDWKETARYNPDHHSQRGQGSVLCLYREALRGSGLVEESMVKPDLTTQMLDAGRQLLELLDRQKFRAPACFWFYFPESDRWRFVIASPEVRVRGPHAAYRKVQAVARKIPDAAEVFAPGDVTLVKDNDPLVDLLRKAISTGPGISGIRFTNNSINGTLIDDAYIYRLT